jgi:hypothetical protein
MSITIALAAWWVVPTVITLIAFIWWLYVAREEFSDSGLFSGLGAIFYAVPALLLCLFAWFVGALCK